jgi:hypothetical protein
MGRREVGVVRVGGGTDARIAFYVGGGILDDDYVKNSFDSLIDFSLTNDSYVYLIVTYVTI